MNDVADVSPDAIVAAGFDPNIIGGLGLLGSLLIVALLVWIMVWKGLALWSAARNSHRIWFIVLLITNTLGILEIIYYLFFREKNSPGQKVAEEVFPKKETEETKEAL